MPSKLSSPSKHGSRFEQTYVRKITPVNKKDFIPSNDITSSKLTSQGQLARFRSRTKSLDKMLTGDKTRDQRTLKAHSSVWQAQEELRLAGWNDKELSNLATNYKQASQYHFEKGNYTKASHFDHLAKAAKKEATTAKRVATTAKNKAERAERVRQASERVAAKKEAKASKAPKSPNPKTPKAPKTPKTPKSSKK